MKIRCRYIVAGVVQGVGFRPFVFRLANDLNLAGFVMNDGFGVVIETEGSAENLSEFENRLAADKPALSTIAAIQKTQIAPNGEANFTIAKSARNGAATHIPPDTAICADCEREMFDAADRRFAHPFISCVNCGPRYTIIDSLPYDRPFTSMNLFNMCAECRAEYENPRDRRFHAQPIACNDCGPALYLLNAAGEKIAFGSEAVRLCAEKLKSGAIVAIKALGGFQLCADAKNSAALQLLRDRKNRPKKPFAALFPSIGAIEKNAEVSAADRELLLSNRRAIVLLKKSAEYELSDLIAPEIDRVGAMLPSAPLQFLLLRLLDRAIAATSANISDAPIITSEKQLFEKLGAVFDFALSHDREIVNACDDSVAQTIQTQTIMVRRARGYAPETCVLPHRIDLPAIAVGAQQKSAIAIAFGDQAVLSPHIGDLFTIEATLHFERVIATLKRLYRFEPQKIVCDLHPRYASTVWAKAQNLPIVQVQHHHAHALAVMAEYGIDSPVLAICWDGTGYGADGAVWGGEFLIAGYAGCDRAAHLREFGLIGGENAIKNPEKIAAALLFASLIDSPILSEAYRAMLTRKINTPATSSIGRLFDGAAYLIGAQKEFGFEGQSGLMIEKLCDKNERGFYEMPIVGAANGSAANPAAKTIDFSQMIAKIALDPPPIAAAKFLNSLVEMAAQIAEPYDLPIVLCGGVFQNKTLAAKLITRLNMMNKKVFLPARFPPNDGAIALGQIAFKGKE